MPKVGRDLAYCPFSAELLVAASAPEVYRLSLSEGRFMAPLPSRSPAVNACGISPTHGLLACAGEDGLLECFDLRQRDSLGALSAAAAAGGAGQGLSALRFDDSGMHLAVGTTGGLVALFDLRSQVGGGLGALCLLAGLPTRLAPPWLLSRPGCPLWYGSQQAGHTALAGCLAGSRSGPAASLPANSCCTLASWPWRCPDNSTLLPTLSTPLHVTPLHSSATAACHCCVPLAVR